MEEIIKLSITICFLLISLYITINGYKRKDILKQTGGITLSIVSLLSVIAITLKIIN